MDTIGEKMIELKILGAENSNTYYRLKAVRLRLGCFYFVLAKENVRC